MQTALAHNILATIAYYDALNYPLTGWEVWQHLFATRVGTASIPDATHYGQIMTMLEHLVGTRRIVRRNGFYVLPHREELITERLDRNRRAAHQLRGLRRIVRALRFVPFVRGVFVTGRLAMKHTKPSSDWDILVVIAAGHIWCGRFLVTAFLHILGKRRHGAKRENRVCLNYFITTESLEIMHKDLFAAHEYAFAAPLFGAKIFERFQFANHWIATYRPHYAIAEVPALILVHDTRGAFLCRTALEKIFGAAALERVCRTWQKKKIMENPKTHLPGSMITATDDALIFLPHPHGPDVFEDYQKRLAAL